MSKAITFAVAAVLLLTTWLAAERKQHTSMGIYLVTSFDFTAYPACRSAQSSNCIQGIRFYDADSGRRLADAPVSANMIGQRRVIGTARVGSVPHGIYAVTVYLDASGLTKEGHPGEVSRFRNAAQ